MTTKQISGCEINLQLLHALELLLEDYLLDVNFKELASDQIAAIEQAQQAIRKAKGVN